MVRCIDVCDFLLWPFVRSRKLIQIAHPTVNLYSAFHYFLSISGQYSFQIISYVK